MTNASLAVGDRAPEFSVPAVREAGNVSLGDYRGRQPLFLGLYRGLHCPFCRRHLAVLDMLRRRIEPLGFATVAIVNTPVDRARLYFRESRTGVRLGADPEAGVHRAYTVPEIEVVEADKRTASWPRQITFDEFMSHRINPTGEMAAPATPLESNDVLNARDGFRMTPEDEAVRAKHGTLLVGNFLIDRDGIVRWRFLEAEATPADIGRLPSVDDIVAAAAAIQRAA
jgi:peroxiredoxin